MHIPAWLLGSVCALVVSAAVRALPEPAPGGGAFYLWFFRFTHLLLANWDKLEGMKNAGEPKGD